MKTTKRGFLKGLLAAIPLSKVIDIEGSENKEIAKKEQENIDKFFIQTGIDKDGYIYSGYYLPVEDTERWENEKI